MKWIIIGGIFIWGWAFSLVYAKEGKGFVVFDKALLESRGISSDVADFFATDKKFYPGDNAVEVVINSSIKKKSALFFQSDGTLCFDQALAKALTLKSTYFGDSCAPPLLLEVRYLPDENAVHLTLPNEYIDTSDAPLPYDTGGVAGLMNYRIYGSVFQSQTERIPSLNGDLELGFNAYNWVFRSREYVNFYRNEWSLSHQEFYLATEVFDKSTLFQVGQLQAKSDSFGGVGFTGMQWSSTNYSLPSQQLLIPVEGTVTEQSVVEISQANRVIYTTMVPPGSFRIEQVSGITSGRPLSVSIKNSLGEVDTFEVPTIAEGKPSTQAASFSIALGAYESEEEGGGSPLVLAEYRGPFINGMGFDYSALWLGHQQYLGYAGTFHYSGDLWSGFIKQKYSNNEFNGLGWSLETSVNTNWWDKRGSVGVALNKFSPNYRSESDVGDATESDNKPDYSYSLSASLSLNNYGSISMYHNKSVQYNDDAITTYGLSYSKSFNIANLSVNLQSRHSEEGEKDESVYVTVQVPLGPRETASWNTNYTASQWYNRLSYRNQLDDGQWSLDYSRSGDSDNVATSYSTQKGLGSVSVGGSVSDNHTYSSHVSLNGGVVLAKKELIASSAPIGETFAVVSIDDTKDIVLSGGGAQQVTNESGLAVINRIPAYQDTVIQVVPSSIPDNVKLNSIKKNVQLSYGSVGFHQFEASHHHSVVLSVQTEKGERPKLGALVSTLEGEYITTVIGQGLVLLEDDAITFPLLIKMGSQAHCRIDAPDFAQNQDASSYETSVICHE